VDAVEADGVAIEVGEGVRFVAEGAEGCGHFEILADAGYLAGDCGIQEVGLDGPEAIEAPAGGGEEGDEVNLANGAGPEVGEVGVAKGAILFLGFTRKNDLAGGEAVGEGRGLAAGESFRGLGPTGASAIGARRIDAAFR
jgi:hypothetical protein